IGAFVDADDVTCDVLAVRELDAEAVRRLHDVRVRQHPAVGRQREAGALAATMHDPRDRRRRAGDERFELIRELAQKAHDSPHAASRVPTTTSISRGSPPRRMRSVRRSPERASSSAASKSPIFVTGVPWSATTTSPSTRPAVSAGLPGCTDTTRSPDPDVAPLFVPPGKRTGIVATPR